MAPPVALLPSVRLRLMMVKVTPGLTLNSRTALPPLIVGDCPVPSRVVSAAMVIGCVKVIVPPHWKVTVPPPAKAAARLAGSQLVTAPPE